MTKRKKDRWTLADDHFLLENLSIDADRLAPHVIGMPDAYGNKRLTALTESGARLAFERMMFQRVLFESAAGHGCLDVESELRRWEQAQSTTLNRMGGE